MLSPEALFRYQIVSAVKARVLSGQGTDAAVRAIAAQTHLTPGGEHKTVSLRSIYRWLAELERDGAAGIETTKPRRHCRSSSSISSPRRKPRIATLRFPS